MEVPIFINVQRLNHLITEFAQIGKTVSGGVTRLALTDLDKQARDLLIRKAKAAGFTIKIDAIGNIFIRRAGKYADLDPILVGSHGDSQPKGGRFDGIYGVLAGLEVLLSLNEQNIQTKRPIDLVMWTNEEGARFSPAMMGSAIFSGQIKIEDALFRQDQDGITVEEALKQIAYVGNDNFSDYKIYKALELHIEQGPVLENHGHTIGVVTGALGQKWYEIEFIGLASHAGTTPMNMRQDAGLGMAHAMVQLNDLGMQEIKTDGRITVGSVRLEPNSPNVIPASAWFTLEVRHPHQQDLERIDQQIYKLLDAIADENNLQVKIETVLSLPPIYFDQTCIHVITEVTKTLNYQYECMISGAGHDACQLSYICPTAMIFIPCINGLSHNEAEDITVEWSEAGAKVLANCVYQMANED